MALTPLEAERSDRAPLASPDAPAAKNIAGRSPMKIAFDRLRSDKVAVVSTAIVLFFILVAIFAPLIVKIFGVELRARPGSEALNIFTGYGLIGPPEHSFTWEAPLGLQPNTGNDLLAEWVYGARTSLEVATIATVTTTIVGIVVGLIGGFARGWLDRIISFILDLFLSFPFLLGALTLAPIIVNRYATSEGALDKAQFFSLIFVLTFFGWMGLARLVRGEVLSLREREFVQAARVIGVPTRAILFRELLPNLVAPIVVSISLGLPAFVTAEAGLAYLGIGLTSRPSWGQTINRAIGYFEAYWLYLWAPVIGVMLLVLALNLLGDSVRDAFDPKTRR
ncbi:MAG: ABC transporter permease [Nocardioidaceae bacterium]